MRVIDSKLELSLFEFSTVPIQKDENTDGFLRYLKGQNFGLFDPTHQRVCANYFIKY